VVVLYNDPRCEHQASGLEAAVEKGGIGFGEGECPEGLKSPRGKPIKENGDCFQQEEYPKESVHGTPKGGIEMEGAIPPLYGCDFSNDGDGRNGWVCIDFIVSLCYQSNTVAPFCCPQEPMGKIVAVLFEGDDIPDGKGPGGAFFKPNRIALPHQGMHAPPRYPQPHLLSVVEFFQDEMIN